MAYPLTLPRALTTADRRSVKLHISDVRGKEEKGSVQTVYRYCPENYVGDGFIPPNLDFKNCYLHNNTKAVISGGPSLKKLISSTAPHCKGKVSPQIVGDVLLHSSKIYHVLSTHSLMLSDSKNFLTFRRKNLFQTLTAQGESGNSVFISVSMVEPLIKATIISPDKISTVKYGNTTYEKAFKTEIGHSSRGCCHIVRVILAPCSSHVHVRDGVIFDLVTAYPVHHFNPSST